jgi:hypothetical protein
MRHIDPSDASIVTSHAPAGVATGYPGGQKSFHMYTRRLEKASVRPTYQFTSDIKKDGLGCIAHKSETYASHVCEVISRAASGAPRARSF